MKKTIMRALIGAQIGLTIGYFITIIISLAYGNGCYLPVVPELSDACGSEITAVIVQAAALLLYGAVWAGASVIWEKDEWSILRQTVTHLVICSAATFPVAYFMRWMEHSIKGAVMYMLIFLFIYLGIWMSSYFGMKRRIDAINKSVGE